jgi:hypothetical protein
MIDESVKPGSRVWWLNYDGVRAGELVRLLDEGHVAVIDHGQMHQVRIDAVYATEHDAWDGLGRLAIATAERQMNIAARALERAAAYRKEAAQPTKAAA